jgi:hypothetical protein
MTVGGEYKLGARGLDIEKRIMKEAYDFRAKRYDEAEYVMLDNDTYEELLAHCREEVRAIQPPPDISKYMGMTIVRTYLAGRGIAVGRAARP